ncbi:hypothetical protein HPS54_00140 [Prevotella sp. PCHR]|uniref:Uncharacterized protein n=1 Tax=Xylanibacter caecicola TaxID=2736294 RepID=A0ABX2AXF9_9BACT|nr:hypothetical protein [Xylanibacter caecicola]NPE23939.1 hypothetical protein [Xylanibacter caecicola]
MENGDEFAPGRAVPWCSRSDNEEQFDVITNDKSHAVSDVPWNIPTKAVFTFSDTLPAGMYIASGKGLAA